MSAARDQRLFSLPFVLGSLLCIAVVIWWRSAQVYPLPMLDLFPLYYGAQAWLHTGNAYDLGAVAPQIYRPYHVFSIGNAYPLPAVLLMLPISLLPPQIAPLFWQGLLVAGLLLALRLARLPLWFLLYVPLLESLRNEQYTTLIVIAQLLGLWAYRERRPWALAWCCALMLTKPTQGALFALALFALARNWRQQLAAVAVVWGGSLLLDPNWIGEWLQAAATYTALANQPLYWALALFALPLLLAGDLLGGALALQLALSPFPIGFYGASSLPLSVLDDPRSKWLMVASFLLPFPAVYLGQAWALALALLLPIVALALLRNANAAPHSPLAQQRQ
jgi:hypothetical protein